MKAFYELKNKRHNLLKKAENALTARDMETYSALMEEIRPMNEELTGYENLMAEQGRFDDDDQAMVNRHEAQQSEKEELALANRLDTARSGNEYVNQWYKSMGEGITPENLRGQEGFGALRNALSIAGGEGEKGGFLVPIDFDDKLHRKMKEFVRLADLFRVEEVTTNTGWRAIETSASRKPLPKVDEFGELKKEEGPSFQKVPYTIAKFGDRIPVSSELLDDNTVGLMNFLVDWFGPRVVMTENDLLFALLNALTAKKLPVGEEIAQLKTTLNKGLNTAHSKMAKILVNQSSYDILDQSVDTNGRGLLVPNPADPDVFRFKQRPVIMADDDLIKNGAGGALPIYVGDFQSFGTLFRRKALEFATTNIGGDAWATDSIEVRGITRMDASTMDKDAACLLHMDSKTEAMGAMAPMGVTAPAPLEERFSIEELTQLAELLAKEPTKESAKEEKDTKDKK